MKTTETISRTSKTLGTSGVDNAPLHTTKHAPECPSRVDTEEDIVKNHEGKERTGLADSPWLLAVGLVVDVEALDSHGV